MMKISGILAVASAAAASAAAISSPPPSSTSVPNSKSERSYYKAVSSKSRENPTAASDKYAPRFDGLRFIETLVTAHR
ncbi:uncharacterized protein LOC131328967 isoform X1 [Rhododendron vialii]|uniref:uncharacterized protein LOC131328967 isoform X1 n=1 Tax=Rhododendron vialii TaxID=182163 RepID=UPI00265F716F|nr:uncharacterized protein LOC131328967 isoform X1 [Rhododendron vialii]XP_058217942.1 uncharacterized protein LOC131328967 isoform X1 [Rhododendron vialii]